MRRPRVLLLCGSLFLLIAAGTASTFTVTTAGEWTNGTFNGVTIRDDRLGLDAPLENIGFETELAVSFWDIQYGDAFVPETGFTGTDAIAFNGSDPVPGAGNVTQLNFSIPGAYVYESGGTFNAWAKHNGTDGSDYRITYRLTGPSGSVEGWTDEAREDVVCRTEQAQQVINDSAATDSWYRFVFTVYPASNQVYCEVIDDTGTVLGGTNLSTTVDYTWVVIRGAGDREPWAWFDDVTIPRYRAAGNYTSERIDNTDIQDWDALAVEAANITANMTVNGVVWAQDSTGTAIERQVLTVANGHQRYPLTVPNSQDAQVMINGSTTDPSTSWSVGNYTVYSNPTNISAPSISSPQVTPDEARPGEEFTFTAELTDDDGDQNTVRLLHRTANQTTWTRINQTTMTPVTVNTAVGFTHTFTAANTQHYFYFNTTDVHNISDTTVTRTFNTTESETTSDGSDDTEATSGAGDGTPGTGSNDTSSETANTTDSNPTVNDTGTDTNETATDDEQPPGTDTEDREPSTDGSDDGPSTGARWLRFVAILIVATAVIGGYFLYVHTQ
jgi:hypothetical protein